MDITRFAIEHNRVTLVVVAVLLLSGAGAY